MRPTTSVGGESQRADGADALECPGCGGAYQRARASRRLAECADCGTQYDGTPAVPAHRDARPENGSPARPLRRDARRELRALHKCPDFGIASSAGERGGSSGPAPARAADADDGPEVKLTPEERYVERYGWMCALRDRARARLAELRARGGEGPRFAAALVDYYREEGNSRDMHGTALGRLAEHHRREGEQAEWLAALSRTDPPRRRRITEADEAIAFGGALLAAATDAYERDAWTVLVPAALPAQLRTARERFLARMESAWARARATLRPDGAPKKSTGA